ncbi:MAG: DNA polymerase domain-containing protein [Gemmatimonadaceae bacterium]
MHQTVPRLSSVEEEWLWGWDPTPGIVSVWADGDGRAIVWRRLPDSGALVREEERFRPWMLLDQLTDLAHLGDRLAVDGTLGASVTYRELNGPGALRYLVHAERSRILTSAVLHGASRRLGHRVGHLRELPEATILHLPPEEQYLVSTGRTYFRDLAFDQLQRLQFDLETTGLDARRDRIFMIAVRFPDGSSEVLEAGGTGDAEEGALISRLVNVIRAADPDVIENHNLHGFDLPFLERRARLLGVPLDLGRLRQGMSQRGARRGGIRASDSRRRVRLVAPGRELIDTMDAVLRHDFSARDLPGHGLKAVARHFGVAKPDREQIPGAQIYETYLRDPDRVRRYATSDVDEVAGIARVLGGAAFALARMAPRRYERLADAGAATGVIDPMLVRAYLRSGEALPAHEGGRDIQHSGAALHLFAAGVAQRVVKADVASLYPSLMRAYRIGPKRDHLGALLALVDGLVRQRLRAKSLAKAEPSGSPERFTHEALSAAMKIVVNSAYGYLAAGGGLTRFADVDAANEVTRRGREVLDLMCRALAERGVTLLEADTDGVYFAVPEAWNESDEQRVVAEVAQLLPPLVQLEFEGRYRAMLSHEPKNYALLTYQGTLILKGVAFRSSRAEPFGEAFLRKAIGCALTGDIAGVRAAYLHTLTALRRRELSVYDVSSRVRLTKSPAQYLAVRDTRRELTYEAMLASGHTSWEVGDRVRVYRTSPRAGDRESGRAASNGRVVASGAGGPDDHAPRDYDVVHYERVLRDSFASRLARAFLAEDFESLFADPDQPSLFASPVDRIMTRLTQYQRVPTF